MLILGRCTSGRGGPLIVAEARRVLKPGGLVFAAAISRFAPLLDGLRGAVFEREEFARIVERDLADGQHRNETGIAAFFTTAFFHEPGELAAPGAQAVGAVVVGAEHGDHRAHRGALATKAVGLLHTARMGRGAGPRR